MNYVLGRSKLCVTSLEIRLAAVINMSPFRSGKYFGGFSPTLAASSPLGDGCSFIAD
jgi:hypothetical protein